MKKVLAIIFGFFSIEMVAQQIPYISQITEARSYWNPATTALGTSMNLDVFVRQQWLGFSGAPTTGFINYQYPFISQRMSAGGALVFDKTGPVNKIGAQLNYAYKVEDALGDYSQFSLGLSAGGHNYTFNGTNPQVNDINDPLLGSSNSGFFPSVGVGFHFISNTREYRNDNSFFFGLAFQQAYESNVILKTLNQQRYSHVVFDFGSRIYSSDGYIEPSLSVNYVRPELLNFQVGAKYEMRDRFWGGLGYSSVNDLNIQAGFILDDFGGRDGKLRVGILANANVSNTIQDFGPGFEFFTRYEFDMD